MCISTMIFFFLRGSSFYFVVYCSSSRPTHPFKIRTFLFSSAKKGSLAVNTILSLSFFSKKKKIPGLHLFYLYYLPAIVNWERQVSRCRYIKKVQHASSLPFFLPIRSRVKICPNHVEEAFFVSSTMICTIFLSS